MQVIQEELFKKLKKMFANIDDIKKRNKMVLEAYELGYSQYQIATQLGFTQAYINRIIKRLRVIVIT